MTGVNGVRRPGKLASITARLVSLALNTAGQLPTAIKGRWVSTSCGSRPRILRPMSSLYLCTCAVALVIDVFENVNLILIM